MDKLVELRKKLKNIAYDLGLTDKKVDVFVEECLKRFDKEFDIEKHKA